MAKREHGFSWEKLDAVLGMGASKSMAASVMDCSEDTIDRRIKKEHEQTFSQYREIKLAPTKIRLQQKALTMGLGGNVTMLIFCLKNLCEWSDKVENTNKGESSVSIKFVEEKAEEE